MCRNRKLFRNWSQNEEVTKKYCEVKKGAKRVVYEGLYQKVWGDTEKVSLCCDDCELFRSAKQRAGEMR